MTSEGQFLKGKVAWVTGGASGMGRAIALELAKNGTDVAIGSLLGTSSLTKKNGELVYQPSEKELIETAKEIESFGVQALANNLDVTSTKSTEQFYQETLKKFGKIDILVNAAGVTAEQTVVGHAESLWMKVMDVNANGPFRTTKLCLPGMIERKWGRIINIASTAASVGASTSAAYCASKAAVLGLSRCVALEGAEFGISCNTISPSWVETSFGTNWMTHIAETAEDRSGTEYMDDVRADNPQKRMIQAREIGALALYLCREEALGMTMQDLTVSAGSLW